jgi:hypothetical protein
MLAETGMPWCETCPHVTLNIGKRHGGISYAYQVRSIALNLGKVTNVRETMLPFEEKENRREREKKIVR